MQSKVRVYGKAQNRTALGIMHAYLVMYPQATIEDLRKAFPKADINPDSGVSEIFVHDSEQEYKTSGEWYFEKDDEVLVLQDGSKVAVSKIASRIHNQFFDFFSSGFGGT